MTEWSEKYEMTDSESTALTTTFAMRPQTLPIVGATNNAILKTRSSAIRPETSKNVLARYRIGYSC